MSEGDATPLENFLINTEYTIAFVGIIAFVCFVGYLFILTITKYVPFVLHQLFFSGMIFTVQTKQNGRFKFLGFLEANNITHAEDKLSKLKIKDAQIRGRPFKKRLQKNMAKLDNHYRLQIPCSIAQALGWSPGDDVRPKLVDASLVEEIVNGDLKVNRNNVLLLVNSDSKNGKKPKTIFG